MIMIKVVQECDEVFRKGKKHQLKDKARRGEGEMRVGRRRLKVFGRDCPMKCLLCV